MGRACGLASIGGERQRLERFIERSTFPTKLDERRQRGEWLLRNSTATFEHALEELQTGADPASAFRDLASLVEGAPRIYRRFRAICGPPLDADVYGQTARQTRVQVTASGGRFRS